MNEFERETVINASDGEPLVRIWTAQTLSRPSMMSPLIP